MARSDDISLHLEFAEALARYNNVIHDGWYQKFYPRLSICTFDQTLDIAPPILMVGSQSSQAQLFGEDWCNSVINTQQTPDKHLEESKAVISGYRDALLNGTSHLDFCTSTIDDQEQIVSYYKTVARVQTTEGVNVYALLGTLTKPHLQ